MSHIPRRILCISIFNRNIELMILIILVVCGNYLIVHDHGLVKLQRAKIKRVGNCDFIEPGNLVKVAFAAARARIPFHRSHFIYFIGHCISVNGYRKLIPFCIVSDEIIYAKSLSCNIGDLFTRSVYIALLIRCLDIPGGVCIGNIILCSFNLIIAFQPQFNRLAQAVLVRFIIPDFSGLHFCAVSSICVDIEYLGKVLPGQGSICRYTFTRQRMLCITRFENNRIILTSNLHRGFGPGISFEHSAFRFGFHNMILSQRQSVQNEHTVTEISKGETRCFLSVFKRDQFRTSLVNSGLFCVPRDILSAFYQFCNGLRFTVHFLFNLHIERHVSIYGELKLGLFFRRHLADVNCPAFEGKGFIEFEHAALVVEADIARFTGIKIVDCIDDFFRRLSSSNRIKISCLGRISLFAVYRRMCYINILGNIVIIHFDINLDIILRRIG